MKTVETENGVQLLIMFCIVTTTPSTVLNWFRVAGQIVECKFSMWFFRIVNNLSWKTSILGFVEFFFVSISSDNKNCLESISGLAVGFKCFDFFSSSIYDLGLWVTVSITEPKENVNTFFWWKFLEETQVKHWLWYANFKRCVEPELENWHELAFVENLCVCREMKSIDRTWNEVALKGKEQLQEKKEKEEDENGTCFDEEDDWLEADIMEKKEKKKEKKKKKKKKKKGKVDHGQKPVESTESVVTKHAVCDMNRNLHFKN